MADTMQFHELSTTSPFLLSKLVHWPVAKLATLKMCGFVGQSHGWVLMGTAVWHGTVGQDG